MNQFVHVKRYPPADLQAESPGKDEEATWLPARKGPFIPMLRTYWPDERPAGRSHSARTKVEPAHAHHHPDPRPAVARAGIEHAFGMGDVDPSLFLSPAKSERFISGVGLTTTIPTATAAFRELSGRFPDSGPWPCEAWSG